MSKVCVHQPDFMPWAGFFIKIMKSDIWVLLDHVENNPRDSASWLRRSKFVINGTADWIGIPLAKEKNVIGVPINRIKISSNYSAHDYRSKNLLILEKNYKDAPYYDEIFPLLNGYFYSKEESLLERNMSFIMKLFNLFEFNPIIVSSSSLNCEERSNELLIEIVKKVDGNCYLSGDGAASYMNLDRFKEENIYVEYNNFIPFSYEQFNTEQFIGGLSIVDLLMNLGIQESKKLLLSELRNN